MASIQIVNHNRKKCETQAIQGEQHLAALWALPAFAVDAVVAQTFTRANRACLSQVSDITIVVFDLPFGGALWSFGLALKYGSAAKASRFRVARHDLVI